MKTINVKIKYESLIVKLFFPNWVTGVTIGSIILFKNKSDQVSQTLLNHELIHVCQYQEQGLLKFLWKYLWKERKVSYKNKESEKEAYKFEEDLYYIDRRWFNYKLKLNHN